MGSLNRVQCDRRHHRQSVVLLDGTHQLNPVLGSTQYERSMTLQAATKWLFKPGFAVPRVGIKPNHPILCIGRALVVMTMQRAAQLIEDQQQHQRPAHRPREPSGCGGQACRRARNKRHEMGDILGAQHPISGV